MNIIFKLTKLLNFGYHFKLTKLLNYFYNVIYIFSQTSSNNLLEKKILSIAIDKKIHRLLKLETIRQFGIIQTTYHYFNPYKKETHL